MTSFDERYADRHAAWKTSLEAAFRFAVDAGVPLSHLAGPTSSEAITATRTEGDHHMTYVETKQDQGTYLYATHGHNMAAGKVAVIGAHEVGDGWHDAFVDREDAVLIVEALTNAIEAHDTREAAAAEEARRAAVAAFKVGDRVEVHGWSSYWNGPGTVTRVWDVDDIVEYADVSVRPDHKADGSVGAFKAQYIRHLPIPDYAAIAATFKPGDLAIVSTTPGTRADGEGYVEEEFHGATVHVIAPDAFIRLYGDLNPDEVVNVRIPNDHGNTNYIHVAHLTRAKVVPA